MNNNATISPATNYFIWKLCVCAGPLYLIGSIVSWGLIAGFLPPPRADWTPLQVSEFFTDNSLRIRVGMVLSLIFQPLYVVLSIATSRVMQRVEGPNGILSTVELLGGLMTWVIVIFGLLIWLAASFRPELRTPSEIMMLNDLAWLAIDVPFMGNALQYCAFATVFLLDKRGKPLVPAWMCWLSYALSAIFVGATLIAFFYSGPFAWHGLINYWVVLGGFFFWLIPASYYMFKAIGRIEQEERDMVPNTTFTSTALRGNY